VLFATVDGTFVSEQSFTWVLRVSRSLDLASNVPIDVMPIFVPRTDTLSLPTRVQLYHEMRHFGRLASVRVNVDIGFPELGDILHFWDEVSAKAALEAFRAVENTSQARLFNPKRVRCTVWPDLYYRAV
jgi:hypothetical protein